MDYKRRCRDREIDIRRGGGQSLKRRGAEKSE